MDPGAVSYERNNRLKLARPLSRPADHAQAFSKTGIIVAIPAYDEEVAIGSVVLRSLKYAEKVLVIDDGSRDRTAEIARLAGAEVIAHSVNEGKGKGIKDAFEYAKAMGAEVLVLIDGDGQHNPDEMPLLIHPLLADDADVVMGSRFIARNGNHVPTYRRIGQEILTVVTNIGSRRRITDSQNGFRAFSRRSFDCFSFEHNNMAIESEMVIDAVNADLRIEEVQICVRYDVEGSSLNPVYHGLSVLATTMRIIARVRPLLVFGLAGVVLLLLGIVAIIFELNVLELSVNTAIIYMTVGLCCIMLGSISLFSALVLSYMRDMRAKISQSHENVRT